MVDKPDLNLANAWTSFYTRLYYQDIVNMCFSSKPHEIYSVICDKEAKRLGFKTEEEFYNYLDSIGEHGHMNPLSYFCNWIYASQQFNEALKYIKELPLDIKINQ